MVTTLDEVKFEVAVANRVLYDLGLAAGVTASLGHASMRVPERPDTFVVKGRGYDIDVLAKMRPEDMVVCDLEGYKIGGPPQSTQCSEVKIHSCLYRERPDVQAVVHVHPRYTVLMSTLEQTLRPMCVEGAELVRRPLPVYPHCMMVWSEEEGMEMVQRMGDSRAILLQGHGATVAARSLEQVVMGMFNLEEQARMNYLAYCAEGTEHRSIPEPLLEEWMTRAPQDELPHFKALMQQIGGNPPRNGPWLFYRERAIASMNGRFPFAERLSPRRAVETLRQQFRR